MSAEYDFSTAKRGRVGPVAPGKTRIALRIDDDVLDWFRRLVHRRGGGSYQATINRVLRDYIDSRDENLESTLRRVLREELKTRKPR